MDRFLLFGIILVAILELTAGQTKNCCSPDQWQGLQSVTIERQWGPEYKVNYLSYDYTNQRVASFVNFTDISGHVSSYETLELYSGPNSCTLYYLDLKTRKCFVDKLPLSFKRFCVPDLAQKVGDFTLGAATESLPVTVYSIKGQNTTSQAFITVTRNLCIPVSQVKVSESTEDVYMSVDGYADIQLGIKQPSVFDVPPECKGAIPLYSDKMFPEFSAKASFTRRFFNL